MPISTAAAISIGSAALAGFGWVASPAISKLVDKGISYLGSDIAKDLDDMETILLPQLQLTVALAKHSPPKHKAPLAKWLARVKNAYLDAEAILHDLEYERLKGEAEGEATSWSKSDLLQRLKELKKVVAEAKTFRELLNDLKQAEAKTECIQNAGNKPFITTLGNADKVFGRDKDCDEIIGFLLNDQGGNSSRKSYSVVAVTGMGGAGKTTLAQYVCEDEKVQKHFSVRIWLCLFQNLDIIELTKQMIEHTSGKRPDLCNLSKLQEELVKTLSGNILVVLDDVWYDIHDCKAGEYQWENLLKPFIIFASRGGTCKIVVTSRSTMFPYALNHGKHIELNYLTPDDFESLLRYRAIDGLQINNPQLKNDLSDTVDLIAKQMSRLPLAAMVVGNQLRNQPNIRFWQATLENVNLSDIMEIFLWTFHRFDVQLQQCFLFCSVFPKDTRWVDLTSLVPFWVALDFIEPSENRNVEDIGKEYIEIMLANSIFHLVDKTYVMHDLFHDLSDMLSAGDCFRVTNTEREIPSSVQHVFYYVNNENLKADLSSICNLSNLRTFILGSTFMDDISEIISKLSTNCRNLRVFYSSSWGYKTLPSVVGDFRNLRLLSVWMSSIEQLPDSVSQLYHLQFLMLPSSVKALPIKLSNLIKLRSIKMSTFTLPPVPYLGKLTSLQQLDEFHVRKEDGYELQQLKYLKEIGGALRIVNLENVVGDAIEVRLTDKTKLKYLELVWDKSTKINGLDEKVIEALQPPTNLEMLSIVGYRGSTYPTWLENGSSLKFINTVKLYKCNALTILPPNFHQFHHCSHLVLDNLEALKELSSFPENLENLSIIKCPRLYFVCENEFEESENHRILESCALKYYLEELHLPESNAQCNASGQSENLNVRRIWWGFYQDLEGDQSTYCCYSRANILKLPSMLRFLHVYNCCVSDGALSYCLRGLATLQELYITCILTITTLPSAEVLKSLQSLRVLQIKECRYLRSLGGLHALPHLESFMIEGCLHLDNKLLLPPTLQSLVITNCAVPQDIFIGDLPSLDSVVISKCHVPTSLSFCQLGLLDTLLVEDCPSLFSIHGLESCPDITTLELYHLPNLAVESFLESWQGCRELYMSSSEMLNKFLSSQNFVPPQLLGIQYCQEEAISFEKSDHLQYIQILEFSSCKNLGIIKSLSNFSTLEFIDFIDCPEILELPELPNSVQCITITACPVLGQRCLPNGLDWDKIKCIQQRWIR